MSLEKISPTNTAEEINSNFDALIGKLSIFDDKRRKKEDVKTEKLGIELRRPVTPIEREITEAPHSFDDFLLLLRRRINVTPENICPDYIQRELLGVIESELSLLWVDLLKIVDYPLYTSDQNRELKRMLSIILIVRCRGLQDKFVNKITLLRKNDIFSEEANVVRLKFQLAQELHDQIHVPTLRRHLYQNLPDTVVPREQCCEITPLDAAVAQFELDTYDQGTHRTTSDEKSQNDVAVINPVLQQEPDVAKMSHNNELCVTEDDKYCKSLAEINQYTRNEKNESDLIHLTKPDKIDAIEVKENKETEQQNRKFPDLSVGALDSARCREKELQLAQKLDLIRTANQKLEEEARFVRRQPTIPQPSTVPWTYNGSVFQIPDIRPTPRRSEITISIPSYGPLWNELANEIDPETVKLLDHNLHRSEEIKEVYKEMMKTVSHDHLSYTQDPVFADCPSRVWLADLHTSSTLESRLRTDRVINDTIKAAPAAPWTQVKMNKTEWQKPYHHCPVHDFILPSTINVASSVKSIFVACQCSITLRTLSILKSWEDIANDRIVTPQSPEGGHEQEAAVAGRLFTGSGSLSSVGEMGGKKSVSLGSVSSSREGGGSADRHRGGSSGQYVVTANQFTAGLTKLPKLMKDRLLNTYEDWHCAWTEQLDTDDFMRFASLQASDYLGVVYHHYDSDAEEANDDEDEDVGPEMLELRRQKRLREMERVSIVKDKIEQLKTQKSVYQKGLWNSASVSLGGLGRPPDLTSDDLSSLLTAKPPLEVEQDPHARKQSAYSRGKSVAGGSTSHVVHRTPLFVHNRVEEDPLARSLQALAGEDAWMELLQQRLDVIWSLLRAPNHVRLDMAIKYSSDSRQGSRVTRQDLEPILRQWEEVATLVEERETALLELEAFERLASDPNRFFAKGYLGSSAARIEESETRQQIYQKIEMVTEKINEIIPSVRSVCDYELTYEGRPYEDKMKWDRVEMLYWLQEERKWPGNVSRGIKERPSVVMESATANKKTLAVISLNQSVNL